MSHNNPYPFKAAANGVPKAHRLGGHTRHRAALRLLAATAVTLLASVGVSPLASPAQATSAYGCGQALIPGSAWEGSYANKGDLAVRSNGQNMGTLSDCTSNGTYGPRYQCTELARRWASVAWGEPAKWMGNAYQAWPLLQHPNGGPRSSREVVARKREPCHPLGS
jgi:hypothetical protein